MRSYDFIIAGGGCAGLSLLYQLLHSPLRKSSILLVDRTIKHENDHTWSFWSREASPFEELVAHRWSQFLLYMGQRQLQVELAPYEYRAIHAIDLYHYMEQLIQRSPQVEVEIGEVEHIESGSEEVEIQLKEHSYRATWLFNSILDSQFIAQVQQTSSTLLQHFLGWRISLSAEVFNPQAVTLFDFRVAQKQKEGVCFVYTLPYRAQEALVEYTLFSKRPLSYDEYATALRAYITQQLSISNYHIVEEEQGVIPMSNYPFIRQAAPRVMNIGTRGGMVKPSTGYAFQRIQEDSQQICHSLTHYGHPYAVHRSPARYRTFDAMILDIFSRTPQQAPNILYRLFSKNRIGAALEFLNERQGLLANFSIMWRMPWLPFLRSYWHVKRLS